MGQYDHNCSLGGTQQPIPHLIQGKNNMQKFDPFQDENTFKHIANEKLAKQNLSPLEVGSRVKVPHGTGTITGFECRGERTTVIVKTYHPSECLQVEIKLDAGNTWSMYPGNPLYYCNPKEVELI